MLQRIVVVGVLLGLAVGLAACGLGSTDEPSAESVELPVDVQLMAGTLQLEETAHPVTAKQAQELLPAWQMLRALRQDGTASEAEIAVVLDQIQAAMTSEQLAAIQAMGLTANDVRDLAQAMGVSNSGPPAGMSPADMMKLSAEERAELMATAAGGGLMDKLVEWLEARTG